MADETTVPDGDESKKPVLPKVKIWESIDERIRSRFKYDDETAPEDTLPEVTGKFTCDYHYSFKHVRILVYAHVVIGLLLAGLILRAIFAPGVITIASALLVGWVELSIVLRLYGKAIWGLPMFELPYVTKVFVFYPDIGKDAWQAYTDARNEYKAEKKAGMRTRFFGRKRAVFDEAEKKLVESDDQGEAREKYGVMAPGYLLETWMRANSLSVKDIANESGGELTVKTVIGMLKNDKGFDKESNLVGLANATNSTVAQWAEAVDDWREVNE